MTLSTFLPLLTLVTLGAIAVVALGSKYATEKRKEDPEAPKSTLAEDAPNKRE